MALRHESTRPWHEVPGFFLDSEYRDVRDRQMKELELQDDLLQKVPIRYALPFLLSCRLFIVIVSEIYVKNYSRNLMNLLNNKGCTV